MYVKHYGTSYKKLFYVTWEENKNLKLKNIKLRLKTIKKKSTRLGTLMVPRAGIEPATRGFSVLCSTDWAIWAFIWWACRDLNPRPTGYEPGALTNWAKGPHQFGGEGGIRTHAGYEPKRFSRPPRYDRFGTSPLGYVTYTL